jgi:nucleoside-diphosphate-sugar epimerase
MSSQNLLITGSTGYIGFRVLVAALEAGWQVRAAVRSVKAAEAKLLSRPSLANLKSNLTFVEVPDILAPGAYKEAIKGVTHVIHCASPLASPNITDYESQLIKPAVTGTLEMLRAASKEQSVQRVVITSSVAANFGAEGHLDAHARSPFPKGPYQGVFQAYASSKVAALNEAEDYLRENKPHYSVVHIMPGFVLGNNELANVKKDLLEGTAAYHIAPYLSGQSSERIPMAVSVHDVAFLHVAALDEKIPGGRAYGASYRPEWGSAWNILHREFPEAVEKGIFKYAEVKTEGRDWDATETEKVFGFKFKTFEEATIEVAKQWISLPE